MPSRSKSPLFSTILPARDAKDRHLGHPYTTTRGREATQGAQVGTRRRETRHDVIRFGDDVLDRLGEIGERVAQSSSRSASRSLARSSPVRPVMADELRRIERHRSRRPARRRHSADRGDGTGVLALAIVGTSVFTALNAPARCGEGVSEGKLRQI
jgi:hypothetical protein